MSGNGAKFRAKYHAYQPVNRATHVASLNLNSSGLDSIARDVRITFEVPDTWLCSRPWSEIEVFMESLVWGARVLFAGADVLAWNDTRKEVIRRGLDRAEAIPRWRKNMDEGREWYDDGDQQESREDSP